MDNAAQFGDRPVKLVSLRNEDREDVFGWHKIRAYHLRGQASHVILWNPIRHNSSHAGTSGEPPPNVDFVFLALGIPEH